MKTADFIKKVNESIPKTLRDEILLTGDLTASEILSTVAQYCRDLYSVMGQTLPELLVRTFDDEKLGNHNLHLNASRIAGNYDPQAMHHFLYTKPMATVIDEDISFSQYGNADLTIQKGDGKIYDNQKQVNIKDHCIVTLFGKTRANVEGRPIVYANDKSYVIAKDNAYIHANGGSYIVVEGDANIEAYEHVNIEITKGSPIIHAKENVRIANCTTKEMDECVRIDMANTVLCANYAGNSSLIIQKASGKNANTIHFHEYEPSMDLFVENMRARHESYDAYLQATSISEVMDINATKEALINLIKNDPYGEGIADMIQNTPNKEAILDILVQYMRLFMENGLDHHMLNQHFDDIELIKKGIYTHAPLFDNYLDQSDIYLFGYDNYCTDNTDAIVEAFEHTAIMGRSLDVVFCNDHCMSLALDYKNLYLRDRSFAGGVECKLIELNEQSMAQFSHISMIKASDQSHLVAYGRTDSLVVEDKSQVFCYYPPKSISKNSVESQVYYLKETEESKISANRAGVKVLDTVDAMNEAIRQSKRSEQARHTQIQRGR